MPSTTLLRSVTMDLGEVLTLYGDISGLAHLVFGRQIQPKLEVVHPAFFLLRQLGMHQAATCRHPVHAAILQQAFVAAAGTMTHTAIYHVGNGLKAAMGMIRKASDIEIGRAHV